MIRKISGVILILAGIGNFIGNYAKSVANKPNVGADIGYGIFFLGLGIFLLMWESKKKENA